jgi:hypothetical protein
MSGLVPSTGTARLAAVIAGHVGGAVGRRRSPLELGSVVSLGGGSLGVQPDSWGAAPFGGGDFLVAQPLERGLVETEDGGDDGHRHALRDPLAALEAGDRVLLAWLGPTPIVIARLD